MGSLATAMYKTFVILRHTFKEAIFQPIYILLVALAVCVLVIFGLLPFFTLGEDTKMYKSVGLDLVLLLVLLATLFTSSRSIYEEIEDRTMLTLMSKPVDRWHVMLGKYLGIVLAAGVAMLLLGGVMVMCIYVRVPWDHYLPSFTVNDLVVSEVNYYRRMDIYGLLPQLVLTWLEICVLAAVGVALSTRFSLVVNLPAVILIYFAGNLTRFIFPLSTGALAGQSALTKGIVWLLSLVLPYLGTFDMKDLALMSTIKLSGPIWTQDPHAVALSSLWYYTAVAGLYAIAYTGLVLSAGMWSFQSRELGGGEG